MAGENAGTAAPAAQTTGAPGGQAAASSSSDTSTPQTQSGAAQAEGSGSKSLKAPLIKDPVDFLARARQRHGISPSKPAESAKPADPAKPADAQAAQAAPAGEQKPAEGQGAAKPTDPKAEDPRDEMAARVAKFSREERELAQRRAAFEADQAKAKAEREEAAKQHEARLKQAETVEKAAKAIEAGDVVGAIRMLKGDANPSAIALQMLEQLQKEDERTMSPAEVERMIAERLKSENEARAKAEEEARKQAEEDAKAKGLATLEGAREEYMKACLGVFSKDKHPFVAAHGLKRETVIEYVESQRDESGRIHAPDPEELLNHFEELYKKRAEAAGWAPKAKEEPKANPAPSFTQSSMVQDSGGRLAPERKRTSLEEDRAELRKKLRIGGVQT